MKLYKVDSKNFDNGDIKKVYRFEQLKNLDDLKNFLLLIKNYYGEISEIIVKKDIGTNEIVFYKKYQEFEEFVNNYNLNNFKEFNIYEFLGNNMHFKIDILNNLIDIYQGSENTLIDGKIIDYEYYRFESGLIVRFNKGNAHCDYLDNNNWVSKNSLITLIDDAAYKYEIIENPLEIKSK